MTTALADIRRGMITLVAGIFTASVSPAVAQPTTPTVVESYLIPSGDLGIQLYVRNKRPGGMTAFRADRTVLYVHGTTQASETTFDLALGGTSWMDDLAEHGWDVWLMDVRGFGGSTKPPEMERPAADSLPIAPAPVAARDVRAVVEHILGKRAVSRISLIGWSRGSALVGWYASENPDKVHRLVLYAPVWIRTPPPSAGPPAPIPAYQTLDHAPGSRASADGCPTGEGGGAHAAGMVRRVDVCRAGHGPGRGRPDAAGRAHARGVAPGCPGLLERRQAALRPVPDYGADADRLRRVGWPDPPPPSARHSSIS